MRPVNGHCAALCCLAWRCMKDSAGSRQIDDWFHGFAPDCNHRHVFGSFDFTQDFACGLPLRSRPHRQLPKGIALPSKYRRCSGAGWGGTQAVSIRRREMEGLPQRKVGRGRSHFEQEVTGRVAPSLVRG